MGPLGHGVVSAGVGAGVWATTGSIGAVPFAFATGVFLDADHVFDYYVAFFRRDKERVFVLAHGWEYALAGTVLLLGIWYHPWLLAAVLGMLGHLIADQVANKPRHLLGYAVLYRLHAGFRREPLFDQAASNLSEVLHKHIPLWSAIEPRLPALFQKALRQR